MTAGSRGGAVAELEFTRIGLPTGVTRKVAFGGAGEPILFLHGFPESHRSWRHLLHNLGADHRVIANAGHFIIWERPELVTCAPRDFLGRTRPDGASPATQT